LQVPVRVKVDICLCMFNRLCGGTSVGMSRLIVYEHEIGVIFEQKGLAVKSKNSAVAFVVYLAPCSANIGVTVDSIRVHHVNVAPTFVL
jgi:hypothetical protein